MEEKILFLSEISLNGFKSFPFKTKIPFSQDITCIVGPNGCGKSNIADAIQWVLGEQKPTEVRLKEMSEVIFSGNDKRKPFSFAEVSILLKNGNEEIKITRKIFSTGESNYYLNGKQVRLKDLKDFLKSENLNINSYVVLSQGEIERVALLKPYEKRYLIEECAGIFRFREKEKMTILKLEDTERNLSFVKNLLKEQEKIAHSLKVQVGRVKAYKKIEEEERRILELLFGQERDCLLKELEKIKEKLLFEEEERIKLIKKLEEMEKEIEELQGKLKEKEKKEIFLREGISELAVKLQSIELNLEKSKEKKNEIEEEVLKLKNFLSESEKKIKENEKILKEKEESFKLFGFEIENLNEMIKKINEDLKLFKKSSKEIEESYLNFLKPYEEIQRNKNSMAAELFIIENQIKKIKSSIFLQEKELETFKERKIASENKMREIKNKLDKSLEEMKEIESFLEKEKEILREEKENLNEKEREFQIKVSEREKIRELIEREKKFLEDLNKGKKTCGILLNAPLEWENFVDLLLEELENSNLSRELYPEEPGIFITPKKIEAPDIEGAIHIKNLLRVENDEFLWVLECLPPIYYVEDIEKAKELSLIYPYFCFFERNGRILKGSIFCNPPYSKAGVVGSKIRVEKLERKLKELEEIIKKNEVFVGLKKKEVERIEKEIENKEKLREEILNYGLELKNSYFEISTNLKNLEEKINEIEINLEKLKGELEFFSGEFHEKEVILKSLILEEEKKKEELLNYKKNLDEIRGKERENEKIIQELLKELKEKEILKEKTLWEIQKLSEFLVEEKNEISKNEIFKKEKELKIFELKKLIEDREKEYFFLKENLEKERENLGEVLQEKEEIFLKLKERQSTLKKIKEEKEKNFQLIEKIKAEYEIKKNELKSLEERAREALGIEISSCPSSEEYNLREALKEVREKKKKFGLVNPLAERDLEEVLEKLRFIKKQKEDLENSCLALRNDLKNLEIEATAKFKNTLEVVNENFQRYFSYLFGGGEAKISLLDSDNPLESGIELLVKPPGKKVQHMMLLSGGERALVSLAFLLSLFSTSPSPFIVLDEADASLDDMNVERFINLVKKLKEKMQVILITHNRRTMEEASLLLGVTMEEPGLSKIVPLEIKEIFKKFAY